MSASNKRKTGIGRKEVQTQEESDSLHPVEKLVQEFEALKAKESEEKEIKGGIESSLVEEGELIKRLRKEKEYLHREWSKKGERAGKEWAQRAHFSELEAYAKMSSGEFMVLPPEIEEDLRWKFEDEGFRADIKIKFENYKQGFLKGVKEVWREVKWKL